MDGQRRRPPPPRISIGETQHPSEMGSDGAAKQRGNIPMGEINLHNNDLDSMEARYAEALAETATNNDREALAKPEGSYPPPKPFSFVAESRQGVQTPDTETDFDWDETGSSDEEGKAATSLLKEEEDAHRHKHAVKRAKRLRKVYLACMRISRPVRTLLFLLLGSGILIVPAVVVWAHFNNSANEVRDNVKTWSIWLSILWASACATSLVVDAIPWMVSRICLLLTGTYPPAVKAKVTLFNGAKFWLKFLFITVWAWVSLSILTEHIFNNSYMDYFKWVLHACQALFGSAVVLYIEKLIVQSVKASFHQNALKDRIEENARALWALDKLAASKKVFKKTKLPFKHFGHGHGHSRNPSGYNTPSASRPGSRAASPDYHRRPYERLQASGKASVDDLNQSQNGKTEEAVVDVPLTPVGDRPTFADRSSFLRQRPNKVEFYQEHGNLPEDGSASPDLFKGHRNGRFRRRASSKTIAEQLAEALQTATLKDKSRDITNTTHSAKKMARQLFEGLGNERDHLEPQDFIPYFATKADAEAAFGLFDKDGNGDISKKEMRSAVSRIYRERKALKASLDDMGSAVRKLDGVLLGVCLIVILFIWFLIFDRDDTVSSLTSISTIVAAISFIFSNAASTLFNSMIFIFSTQPYSIGDLVFIDDDPLVVKEFGLMSTVFERVDGQYMITPNSILSTSKHILNVRRSGSMWETTNIQIAYDTPLEVMSELRSRMRQYVNENSREWGGGLDMNVNAVTNMNSIEIIVALQHKSNWQDWGGRWNRRTKLMRHLKTVLDELRVTYSLPVQPVHLQLRGGPSPFKSKFGNNSTANTGLGNGNTNNVSIGSRYLSPEALGNGANISGGSFQVRS